jgi:hypothetical protein
MSRDELEIRDDLFEVHRTRGFPTTNTRWLFTYCTIGAYIHTGLYPDMQISTFLTVVLPNLRNSIVNFSTLAVALSLLLYSDDGFTCGTSPQLYSTILYLHSLRSKPKQRPEVDCCSRVRSVRHVWHF